MRISKNKISFIMAEKDMLQKDLAIKADMSRGNLSTEKIVRPEQFLR